MGNPKDSVGELFSHFHFPRRSRARDRKKAKDDPDAAAAAAQIEAARRANPAAFNQNAQLGRRVGNFNDNELDTKTNSAHKSPLRTPALLTSSSSSPPPSSPKPASDLYEKSPLTDVSTLTYVATNESDQSVAVGNSAYAEAWRDLDEDLKKQLELSRGTSIRDLFVGLDEADQQHQAEAWLQRGQASAGIGFGHKICTYLDLFSSFIPAPGADAALGLVKGTLTILLTLCGRYDELTGHIKELCDRVPLLDRYSSVVSSDQGFVRYIHNVLVQAYTVLLHFYTKVSALLMGASRIDKLRESFKSDIPNMVGKFNNLFKSLGESANAEQFASIMEIKEGQQERDRKAQLDEQKKKVEEQEKELEEKNKELEKFVESKLRAYRRTKIEEQSRQRSSKACEWILDEPEFNKWKNSSTGAVLTMFGDMGRGKSVVTSYGENHMGVTLDIGSPNPSATILAFYCKAQERMPLCDVYKGLIYQWLEKKPSIQSEFKDWHDTRVARRENSWDSNSGDVLQNAGLLRKFLQEQISKSSDRTFFFLDGLDEMVSESRQDLLDLLREVLHFQAHVKAFLSSQHRDDIHESLDSFQPSPETERYEFTMGYIEMRPTLERDRVLAEHLVFAIPWKPFQGDALKREVVDQIAQQAEGSAIWLQMAATTLESEKVDIDDDEDVKEYLKWLKTDPSLIQLYSRLFESRLPASRKSAIRRKRAEAALESLTVARRPLSIGELASAAFLDESDVKGLESLEKQSRHLAPVMDHIRPFVSVDEKTGCYSLVHQSLVDLILDKPPTQWESLVTASCTGNDAADPANDTKKLERQERLHADMLSRCVKYIMFDEVQEKDLAGQLQKPAGEEEAIRELLGIGLFDDSEEDIPQPNSTEETDPNNSWEVFDPETYGFGKFFAYAGAYWPDHFAAASPKQRPEPSRIVQLCGHGTRCLANWVEMWKRPNCRFVDERPDVDIKEMDPLAVVAHVDPTAATLRMIAQEKKKSPTFFVQLSGWNMLTSILMKEGTRHLPVIRQLLDDPVLSPEFCDDRAFIWLLREFGAKKPWGPVDWPGSEWEPIFRALMEKLGPRLEPRVHFTLRLACAKGCLMLVKLLFEAAEKWPELGAEMLSDRQPRADEESNASLFVHQSVGEAANWGHVEIVRFLCQQKGIEPHLKYINHDGYNIFHQASARFPHSEMFEILVPLWPQGVHEPNKKDDTPLDLLIFSHKFRDDPTDGNTAALKTLLRLAKYEPGVLDGQAMRLATNVANTMLCRLLVEQYGADPWKVVEVGPDGVARLRNERRPLGAGPNQDEREVVGSVLRCFCDLTHLPVPDEYK